MLHAAPCNSIIQVIPGSLEQVLKGATSNLDTFLAPLVECHAGPVEVGRCEGGHGSMDPLLQLLQVYWLRRNKNLCLNIGKYSII